MNEHAQLQQPTPTSVGTTTNNTAICCENFTETLNKVHSFSLKSVIDEDADNSSISVQSSTDLNSFNNYLTDDDIVAFLNYCNTWQQK